MSGRDARERGLLRGRAVRVMNLYAPLMRAAIFLWVVVLGGCDTEHGGDDAGPPGMDAGGGGVDSGGVDSGSVDSGGGGGVDSGGGGEDAGTPPEGVAALEGYWVWKQTVDGETVEDITAADMEWMVGPSGWPGCPAGISCTRTGIHLVAFATSLRAHYAHRVTTGSDTQHPATFTTSGDLLTFHRTEAFSCAHPPGGSTADAADYYARFRREGEDLWLSVGGFGGLPFSRSMPEAAPTRWIVYRRITEAEFHGRYDHPYCGAARKGVESCHPLCASSDVLGDAI